MKTITITLEDAKQWLHAVDETETIKMATFEWIDFMPTIDRLRALVKLADKEKPQ